MKLELVELTSDKLWKNVCFVVVN